MTQLLDGIGIQKGSFYATFGSKRGVFIAALCHDTETWTDQFADAAPPALLLHADARVCRPVPRRGRRTRMFFGQRGLRDGATRPGHQETLPPRPDATARRDPPSKKAHGLDKTN